MEKSYVIYKCTNLVNGKVYIGKTYDFEKRKREHIYDIDNDLPFHRALKRYGIENFDWEIIDSATNDEEIREKEVYWIKYYKSCIHMVDSHGYNITLGGEGGVSWNSRPIIQFDSTGEYVDEYVSYSHASVATGIDRKGIEACVKHINQTAGGYRWLYKDEWDGKSIGEYIKPPSKKRIEIVQLDLAGSYVAEYKSVLDAANKTGIRRTTISGCLTGKNNRAGGFQWLYKEDYMPEKDYSYGGIKIGEGIYQLNDNWEIIGHFANCSEAARALGFDAKVHKLIHKRLTENKRCRGYYWRKVSDYKKGTRLF